MKAFSLHREALKDVAEAVAFYEQMGGHEVAFAFTEQIEITFALVEENPTYFPRVSGYRPVQKCRVKGFPYALYYLHEQERIWVIAVAHGSRRPGFWTERL